MRRFPFSAPHNFGSPRATTASQVVAAEERNEVDRALQEETPKPPVAAVSKDQPAPRRAIAVAGNDHSLWNETSLIGKVFIGLGTLLTIASAARMFMA